MTENDGLIANSWLEKVRARTPARLLIGRSGASYKTSQQMQLRAAHAAAIDSVRHEFDPHATLGEGLCRQFDLFEVQTQAISKAEYLLRPDRGRTLSEEGKQAVVANCTANIDIQVAIGDGLSVSAVKAQVPTLLPPLIDGAKQRNWSVGRSFAIRYCRVGVLNEIGDLLKPRVAILLIGERPGLATAESLSAYLAYRPCASHTDAERNLVSNIHVRGTPAEIAAQRILDMAAAMMSQQISGTKLDLAKLSFG